MKFTRIALAAAACCGLVATGAQAQGLHQPGSVQHVALTYDYYAQDNVAPSPSDLAAAETSNLALAKDASQKDGKGCGCDAKGGDKGGKGGKGCSSCEPWRIFPTIGNGWTVEGWISGGATANADNPASNYNGPVTFNDRADEAMLNQLYLSMGRDADNGGCGWAWGGRMDLLYGQDYIFTQAAGLETQPDGTNAWNGSKMYGLAMPQVYGEVALNDLSVKLGHFYTIMGYEVVPATGNFFYSHAYTMQYGEPFTHTGGLATWDYSDRWTLYGGLVNGWDKFDAVSDNMAFLGGATYTPDHERYTLTGTFISGQEDGVAPPTTTRSGYSLVFNYDINCRLKYVLQHDNFWQDDAIPAGVVPAQNAEWYGINQYLFYTVNDCWKLGARVEWFRDDDGVRLTGAPIRETATGGAGLLTPAAAAGNYYNITVGANWTPRTNLTVRPELRWDWSDGTTGQPYDSGTKDGQFTAAFDAIVVF
ncbi:MAG: porin [Planctomycetota bacterium]|nr:porin [Planctomycetota bacterium]